MNQKDSTTKNFRSEVEVQSFNHRITKLIHLPTGTVVTADELPPFDSAFRMREAMFDILYKKVNP